MDDPGWLLPDPDPDPDPEPPRRRRRRRGPLLAVSVLALLLLGGLTTAAVVVVVPNVTDRLSEPADYPGPGQGEVTIEVRPGDTLSQVGAALAAADVVKTREAFQRAARAADDAQSLRPGFYVLHRQMAAADALTWLLSGEHQLRTRVTIPEGFTAEKIVNRIAAETDISADKVRAALGDPAGLGLPDYAEGRAEGLLFPATYPVEPDTTATELLSTMVDRFFQAAAELNLSDRAAELGVTPYEAVIVASLTQAEAKIPADFGKVARVVYNRLAIDMPLQFDSTVNYAREERKNENLTNEDLEIQSPYNTYHHLGLPPTPIGSPGMRALRAALEPTPGDWLYFVTIDSEGNNAFAETYEEHLENKRQAEIAGVQ